MNIVQTAVPFIAAAIIAVLTFDIFRRYQQHRGTHKYLLFWGAGLAMFGIASFCGGVLYFSWNELAFIGWFLFGAMLNAAWIGQGTMLLLFRRRWVDILSIVLVILSVFAAVLFLSPQGKPDPSAFQPGVSIFEQYKQILPADAVLVRRLTAIFNIYGTVTLVGGALWSTYLFYRKRILPNRVVGNVLIAAGALAIAAAGSFTFAGHGEFHELSQLVFAVLIYAGFIIASKPAAVQPGENTVGTTVTA